jgi:hypothetical protein
MRRPKATLWVAAAAVLATSAAGAVAAGGGGGASAGGPSHGGAQGGPHQITIERWLTGTPTGTGLASTLKGCFRLRIGGLSDRGGGPRWTDDASYVDRSSPAEQCARMAPIGGAMVQPPMNAPTLYSVQTLTGRKGQIHIQFAGVYDLATTFAGSGTWVITGGTGAYRGLLGEGSWNADASTFPYTRHTETGTVTWPARS